MVCPGRRAWSGPTARSGLPTGTTSSRSTIRRRPGTASAKARRTRRRCAITSAAASTASSIRRAGGEETIAIENRSGGPPQRAGAPTTCSGACTRSGCIVERGQKDVVPQLIALARNQSVDEIGTNGGALHALWTLQGLGELNATTTDAYRAAVDDLKHPAAGVRKAAAMVLPHAADAAQAILAAGLLHDPDLHTRLAATLAIADMPTSAEIGQALYAESPKPDNYADKWLSRAFYIAGSRHQKSFTAAYHADRSRACRIRRCRSPCASAR